MKTPRKAGKRKLGGSDDELWELRFTELVGYKEKHGHTRVPARWPRHPSWGIGWRLSGIWRGGGTIEPDGEALAVLGLSGW